MLNLRLSTVARNTQLDALAALTDGGYLRIYNGTQPASPDIPVSTQTLLAELRFSTPAFGSASGGIITAEAITDEDAALSTGVATWFRVLDAGENVLWDGSVGSVNSNINLSSTSIQSGARVSLSSFIFTLAMQQNG
jgi:hypothetical protein